MFVEAADQTADVAGPGNTTASLERSPQAKDNKFPWREPGHRAITYHERSSKNHTRIQSHVHMRKTLRFLSSFCTHEWLVDTLALVHTVRSVAVTFTLANTKLEELHLHTKSLIFTHSHTV